MESSRTVDGRNPANHLGCKKTLQVMGLTTYLNWLARFLPSTVWTCCHTTFSLCNFELFLDLIMNEVFKNQKTSWSKITSPGRHRNLRCPNPTPQAPKRKEAGLSSSPIIFQNFCCFSFGDVKKTCSKELRFSWGSPIHFRFSYIRRWGCYKPGHSIINLWYLFLPMFGEI